jgi:hypothetical protein
MISPLVRAATPAGLRAPAARQLVAGVDALLPASELRERFFVNAWYGVGYTNAAGCGGGGTFDDCSYALAKLHANSSSQAFEMAVAGIGVGFCGVQFASDGMALWAVDSGDMGATCNARATLCVSATDLATPVPCGSASYALPALGRRAGARAHEFGASQYPDAPNLTLDGTETDSLHFRPGRADRGRRRVPRGGS